MNLSLRVYRCNYSNIPYFDTSPLFAKLAASDLPNFPLFRPETGHLNYSTEGRFTRRAELTAALKQYNDSLGNHLPEKMYAALKESGKLLITGQQPNLLTGPMYTFLKTVSIISLARNLAHRSETPIIPCFWTATEDHDISEINRVFINGKSLSLPVESSLTRGNMPPVGSLSLSNNRDRILKFLQTNLPLTQFTSQILDMVADCRFETFSTLFTSLMLKIFTEYSLVFVSPEILRKFAAPVLAEAVTNLPQLTRLLVENGQALIRLGVPAPLDRLNVFRV